MVDVMGFLVFQRVSALLTLGMADLDKQNCKYINVKQHHALQKLTWAKL